MGPRWLYGHGFASSAESVKGRALSERFARRGVELERLDLRRPSMEHLRLSAGMAHVRERIGGERDRAVLLGSSLGGLTMARVAAVDARAFALVLLAPAFRLPVRWRERLGAEGWRRWREEGSLEIDDTARGAKGRVDFGFPEELERMDAEDGGFPDVRVPTLVIHGVGDDVVPVEGSRAWAKGKRHVRLVEVEDGHDLGRSIDTIYSEIIRFMDNALGPP
jgi:pimeloyl-ACP methyl ester carboxylesterase